jgi:hypothetical protein
VVCVQAEGILLIRRAKKSNPHLRQVIEFDTGGGLGETKDNYRVVSEYRELLRRLVNEWDQGVEETEGPPASYGA